jgi:hypothetical protein
MILEVLQKHNTVLIIVPVSDFISAREEKTICKTLLCICIMTKH